MFNVLFFCCLLSVYTAKITGQSIGLSAITYRQPFTDFYSSFFSFFNWLEHMLKETHITLAYANRAFLLLNI